MSNNNPGCLGFILQAVGLIPKLNNEVEESLPYAKRDDFLSPAELSFYKVLSQAISDKAIICPKVSLKEIFFVKTHDKNDFPRFRNKINLKHVDFLLCSKDTFDPICGIELDDTSHARADRVERDVFVEKVFASAGLKLLRFPNKKSYIISEIVEQLNRVLGEKEKGLNDEEVNLAQLNKELHEETNEDELSGNIPTCPKCGIPMILRKVSRGEKAGEEFWGCVNFPKCRETMKSK